MNEATVLLLHHDRNEIMTVTMHYLVETTLMARIDCKRLSSFDSLGGKQKVNRVSPRTN
jgi:hypothetical protein